MQPEKWTNLLRDWHDDLIWWARHGIPRLVVIFLLAIVFIRVLGMITRNVIEFSKRRSAPALRLQQIRTLTGVIHSIGVFVVVFIALMQALPIFGVHIEPLLASAGIAGLAVGFGAQALVKDVINGFFILVENQYDIGDYIRVAGVKGTVEAMNMRSTVLRDEDGTVHIIPNSEIKIVSNATRDWSQLTLRVTVAYSEPSERIVKLLQEVGEELRHDPAYADDIVSDIEV